MKSFSRFLWVDALRSILAVVFKRLRFHAGLSLSSAVGIVSILGLVVAVPVFTNGVLSQVLKEQLTEKAALNHRSLFSFHAYYPDNEAYYPLTLKQARGIVQFLRDEFEKKMGLNVDEVDMQVRTHQFAWKPVEVQSSNPAFNVIYMSFMSSSLLQDRIKLVEGDWPQPEIDPNGTIQVAVYEEFADDNFLNVGDIYQTEGATIQIAGIFRVLDPNDQIWFYVPKTTFRDELWVPMSYFESRLPTLVERTLFHTSWYVIVDDSSLRFSRSLSYTHQMTRLENGLRTIIPKGSIDYSPLDMLKAYENRLRALIVLFYTAGAPVFVLALLFIGLAASIAVGQYEQETAVIAARGTSSAQILLLNLVETLVLILLVTPLALLVGWAAAVLMGQTQLFMQFTPRTDFTFSLMDVNLNWLVMTILAIFLARFLPLLGRSRPSILSFKQERSRSSKPPAWERFYLDLMLLVPAAYAYFTMRGQVKTSAVAGGSSGQSGYDPLMFLASSLFTIALCMLALRLFPVILRLLAGLVSRLPHAWIYLAVQEISRKLRDHASVMLLIMISLTFSIFSASMARTLDCWLRDEQYYKAGSDLVVREYEIPASTPNNPGAGPEVPTTPFDLTQAVASMISLEKHLKQPDIQTATYVGRWPARCSISGSMEGCSVMGIDRLTFPATAFFRRDFATDSLGSLMNELGNTPLGVLIPQTLSQETGLLPGDSLRVEATIGAMSELVVADFKVVGIYRYFPTVYPSDPPTLITNLDVLFGGPEAVSGTDVWLTLRPGAKTDVVVDGLRNMAIRQSLWVDVRGDALEEVNKGMRRPEWVGIFGVLNVGFLLTGLLPGIGYVLYSIAALQKRLIQFGILQALGLSALQMAGSLVLEQLMLMLVALAGGVGVGFATCALFLPFLQVGAAGTSPTPPFMVIFGWSEAGWLCLGFGGIFLISLLLTLVMLSNLKIFQAVKMGEVA